MKSFFICVFIVVTSLSVTAQDTTGSPAEQGIGPFIGEVAYGDPKAPVEVIEYASLTCHVCGNFAERTFPMLEADYIKTGKVRFVIRHFLLNRVDLAASVIARCGTEDQAQKMVKKFLETQEDWMHAEKPLDAIMAIGKDHGLIPMQMQMCIRNQDLAQKLIDMTKAGAEMYKIRGTPTLVVNGMVAEDKSYAGLKKMIEAALK
ncbi:thioredoxin domain-containing protein [Temperatibacter marinus]|uniref:Thioredoxin domain-containing protein n=1 Tax=Temperatibacter marinus TaxID=1456591 RepID=A0AA52H8Z6_9PROT|nr:thioredoxin domain-containing protein [Temperatibacter marinus]WND01987.1 thioredoxin domain-containing protein [Temperatibacter marinus]